MGSLRFIRAQALSKQSFISASSPIKDTTILRKQKTLEQSVIVPEQAKRVLGARFGKWVEEHIYSMDADGMISLIDVLDSETPELWKWLSGQEQPPEAVKINPVFSAIHEKVMINLSTYSALETQAVPGQP